MEQYGQRLGKIVDESQRQLLSLNGIQQRQDLCIACCCFDSARNQDSRRIQRQLARLVERNRHQHRSVLPVGHRSRRRQDFGLQHTELFDTVHGLSMG